MMLSISSLVCFTHTGFSWPSRFLLPDLPLPLPCIVAILLNITNITFRCRCFVLKTLCKKGLVERALWENAKIAPPGFEPGSQPPKGWVLDRYTTGLWEFQL